ncbi:MAG: hypothetical protein ACTSRU_16885 [Candidatus Hodarchaeales archaeon]
MANTVFLNQKLILNYTDVEDIDMDTVDFRVDYWAPSNQKDEPTGTMSPSQWVTVALSSTVVITVPKNLLNEVSSTERFWRFQIIDKETEIAWMTMCFEVKRRGLKICDDCLPV